MKDLKIDNTFQILKPKEVQFNHEIKYNTNHANVISLKNRMNI